MSSSNSQPFDQLDPLCLIVSDTSRLVPPQFSSDSVSSPACLYLYRRPHRDAQARLDDQQAGAFGISQGPGNTQGYPERIAAELASPDACRPNLENTVSRD